jgi:hypothetical protein
MRAVDRSIGSPGWNPGETGLRPEAFLKFEMVLGEGRARWNSEGDDTVTPACE